MSAPLLDEGSCPSSVSSLRHVVVIATRDRWSLLERALRSVAAQRRAPDRIVLVVDRGPSPGTGPQGFLLPEDTTIAVEVLANRRTPGVAGAWTTALDHLVRTEPSPEDVVVSLLDDDDWWEPDHLARVDAAATRGAEIIATPLVRHDERTPEGRTIAPPDALCAGDFLMGNPGVQGSNLSARLSTLLMAGCFDEALSSTTDRDLCIRIADLGAVYAAADGGAAHHDTLHGNPRLSDAGSATKLAGLNVFFAKYSFRMSASERTAAEARARELFGWEPPAPVPVAPVAVRTPRTVEPLALVVGVIIDGNNPARAFALLDGLARLRRHARVTRLDVVLVENGAAADFERVLDQGRVLGLPLWPARLEAQRAVAADVGLYAAEITDRKSIAAARSLLHRFVFEVAQLGEVPVAWILDDDARITGDLDLFVDDVVRARAAGIDVLIGGVTGAPPIPASTALRVQLVDLHGFLRGAAGHAPSEPPPDAETLNRSLREGRRDYYHDLARRETDRLETTFLPELPAADLGSAVSAVLRRSERILAGEQIFRPIPAPVGDPLTHMERSSLRGGNTFVFALDLLRDVPNLSPWIAGRRLRRSDMIWAALARLARGRNVVAAPIVVEHDRSHDPLDATDHDKLLDDVLGYAFFRAFEERLEKRSVAGPLSDEERSDIQARTHKYVIERFAAYRLSHYRICGLARALDRLLNANGDERPWWLTRDRGEEALRALYGCGKPRSMPALAAGRTMEVFDPDPSLRRRWAVGGPGIPFLDVQALDGRIADGKTYDVVVCALVLCALDDDAMNDALARIRRLVAPAGRGLIAACDPTSHHVRATTYQERLDAHAIPYDGSATYLKRIEGAATPRVEHHRPLAAYRRSFARHGLAITAERTIDGLDVERFEPVSEFVLFELSPLPEIGLRTTLLIKACAQETETIRDQVEHIVRQLGAPRAFDEVVLLVDPFEGPFPREHHRGDLDRLRREAAALVETRLVDRVILGPRDGEEARRIADRWFGVAATAAHSDNGQPLLGILDAIEHAKGELVFHADADLLIARPDPGFDPIAEAASVFAADGDAVTLALPVRGDMQPVSRASDAHGPYRVEAAAGWIHRARLCALRPLPNELRNARLALPWHRAVDRMVRDGRARSLRRGSPGIWCAGPDNDRKHATDAHLLLLDRVEAGQTPPRQAGRMDVVGTLGDWLGPKRTEPMIVVICGRNVPPGRIRRCLDSLSAQRDVVWGVVVIDDASDNGADEVLRRAVATLGPRVTYVRRRRRAGLLANTAMAVRDICSRADSIVVLVDLDDALGPRDALATVQAAYAGGADVTVGSMVRTDKDVAYAVDFTDPRGRRGGNVWQHLRTFRKALFDRLEIADLKLDGSWVEPPSDWAMMVPIVEMAVRPVWILRPLYLHEPSGARTAEGREEREGIIARVLARPSYRSSARAECLRPRELTVLCYHRIADGDVGAASVYRQRGMAIARRTFEAQMRALPRRFTPIGLSDIATAARNERSLPERPVLVTFDDGYRDLVDAALPILDRAGIPAVAFVRAPRLEGLPSWAPLDLLYHVLSAASANVAEELCPAAREALLTLSHAEQIERVLAVAQRLNVDASAFRRETLYLDASFLRALPAAGVALGAHGIEHVRWTTLPSEQLARGAAESVAWLRSIDPGAPLAVAYPDAAYDARVARIAEAAGFMLGFGLAADLEGVSERMGVRRRIAQDDVTWIDQLAANFEAERAR